MHETGSAHPDVSDLRFSLLLRRPYAASFKPLASSWRGEPASTAKAICLGSAPGCTMRSYPSPPDSRLPVVVLTSPLPRPATSEPTPAEFRKTKLSWATGSERYLQSDKPLGCFRASNPQRGSLGRPHHRLSEEDMEVRSHAQIGQDRRGSTPARRRIAIGRPGFDWHHDWTAPAAAGYRRRAGQSRPGVCVDRRLLVSGRAPLPMASRLLEPAALPGSRLGGSAL